MEAPALMALVPTDLLDANVALESQLFLTGIGGDQRILSAPVSEAPIARFRGPESLPDSRGS